MPRPNTIDWSQVSPEDLRTTPPAELATRLGCSRGAVYAARERLEATGSAVPGHFGRPSTRLVVHLEPETYAHMLSVATAAGIEIEEWAARVLVEASIPRRSRRK